MRYPTLAEAFRGVRGVYLSDDRGYQALGFRGFGRPGSYGNRVLITLDGMPLNGDWYGRPTWASTAPRRATARSRTHYQNGIFP